MSDRTASPAADGVEGKQPGNWQKLGEEIDKAVEAYRTTNNIPGIAVSIQVAADSIYQKGFGEICQDGPPPSPVTSFQIDSLSKAFTGICILRLLELEHIRSINDPLGKYLSEISSGQPLKAEWLPITLHQLLGMTSGIPDHGSASASYIEVLEQVAQLPQNFDPGCCYEYSNPNYMLLGLLIDKVAPLPYQGFLRTDVLDKFGLSSETGLLDRGEVSHPACRYDGGWMDGWRSPYCGYSAGGLCATVQDLGQLAIGLQRRIVLQPSSYDLMWSQYAMAGPCGSATDKIKATTPFGCGWAISPPGFMQTVNKDGGGYGWSSDIHYQIAGSGAGAVPDISVCVLMNTTGDAPKLAEELCLLVTDYLKPPS